MSKINLDNYSLQELKNLQKDIVKAIGSFEERKLDKARAALEEKAREMGFSLAQLANAASPRKRSLGIPKYRHPENPSITWSGRGRKPKWVVEHLAAGRPLEELEI